MTDSRTQAVGIISAMDGRPLEQVDQILAHTFMEFGHLLKRDPTPREIVTAWEMYKGGGNDQTIHHWIINMPEYRQKEQAREARTVKRSTKASNRRKGAVRPHRRRTR